MIRAGRRRQRLSPPSQISLHTTGPQQFAEAGVVELHTFDAHDAGLPSSTSSLIVSRSRPMYASQ